MDERTRGQGRPRQGRQWVASCLYPLKALTRAAFTSSAFIHGYAALVFAIAMAW
jgi:hypothetical protein